MPHSTVSLLQLSSTPFAWISNEIQVSGMERFPESEWRKAILYYLFGIWSNKLEVTHRPKICFGNVTLRLDSGEGVYYAYGTSSFEEPPSDHYTLGDKREVVVNERKEDVEIALVRFVKDNQIRQLVIGLKLGHIVLWKKPQRSQYGIAVCGIPRSWGVHGPEW